MMMNWNPFAVAEHASKAVALAAKPLKKPERTQKLNIDDLAMEHSRLSKELGLPEHIWIKAPFEAFLAENFICAYSYSRVADYMGALVQKEKAKSGDNKLIWAWKPLSKNELRCGQRVPQQGGYFNEVYRHAVPVEVLLTVQKIKAAFPSALFFVTDYVSPVPDPFLGVGFIGLGPYVIERWDEPGFRMA